MSKAKMLRPLRPEELEQVAVRFRMLGEPMRLRILQTVCGRPRTVTEIVEATGASQANVSKHLALLAAAGVLTREKQGQCVYYGMKDRLALDLCHLVRSHLAS